MEGKKSHTDHLGNNKGVLELMKTYCELKHLSHLDNVYIYIYIDR